VCDYGAAARGSFEGLVDGVNMDVWFVRSNGETGHNQRGTKLYVPGEPPQFPARRFNYRRECLTGGFVRIGWPASGDLRELGWRTRAQDAYGGLSSLHVGYLEQFAGIRTGDLVVIPADREKYDVHMGIVQRNSNQPVGMPGWAPYFYYYDVPAGDWYENAHRIPVQWQGTSASAPSIVAIPGLGGLWLKAFGRVESARDDVVDIAKRAGIRFRAV
jgi:hypothetical protein